MIYVTDRFKKEYSTLDNELKNEVIKIVNDINTLPSKELPKYLDSLYLSKNGRSKWTGINKTLFHLYPQKKSSEHRIFYCYASDLDNDELMDKSNLYPEDIIFIAYTKSHKEADEEARKYNKSTIDYLYIFEPPIEYEGLIKNANIPSFWFRLTEDQYDVLRIEQPASVKGSAGTGKTFISFELLKDWIVKDPTAKILYLTYTEKLLDKVKTTLKYDGLDINHENINIIKFQELLSDRNEYRVIGENKARTIIKEILESFYRFNPKFKQDIIFTDYFVYSYIRGLMKGRVKDIKYEKATYKIDDTGLDYYIKTLDLGKETTKTRNVINESLNKDFLTLNNFNKHLIPLISSGSQDRNVLIGKLYSIFNQEVIDRLNDFRKPIYVYNFIEEDKIKEELKKDGLSEDQINGLFMIKERYDKELEKNRLYDDNDYARYLLNEEIENELKYDGIIIDEVQDLTEIQIIAITKMLKDNTDKISFFGDPNQTINPTVYNYGRFNSYLWNRTQNVNQESLKRTHRCGQNLLEYINHLVDLRRQFNLTTNTEDLEKEESARLKYDDGHFACLIEDEVVINHVLESLSAALDFYLIVDNEQTREEVLEKIKLLDENYTNDYEDKIITVQNSKGLESTNVIMYNLVSDNIHIFNNLMNENNKVSSMTFNKFYVSVTRAKNSVIICETGLEKYPEIKETMFYVNGKKIPEDITEDDIEDYLEITTDPERFYDQAVNLMENHEYEKAYKKSNIALRHLLNQFDKDDFLVGNIPESVMESKDYKELIRFTSNLTTGNLENYQKIYFKLISNLKIKIDNNLITNDDVIDTIIRRYGMLEDSLRIRKVYNFRLNYLENREILDDSDKLIFHEEFILLNDYEMTMTILNDLKGEIKQDYINVANHIFGNTTFDKVRESFNKTTYNYDSIPISIIDKELEIGFETNLKNKIEELRGLL